MPRPRWGDTNQTDMVAESLEQDSRLEKAGLVGSARRRGAARKEVGKLGGARLHRALQAQVKRFYFKCRRSLLENNMV